MAKKLKKELHPWRLCPVGTYFRKGGPVKAYTTSSGKFVSAHTRIDTCAENPTKKDQLYPDEINEIAKLHFKEKDLTLPTKSKNVLFNKFDLLIAGWTKYWNEVLNPSEKLEPNFVKGLIDSESTFDEKAGNTSKTKNKARGLMQLRNQARQILADEKGEIKDHYITITNDELYDANINICAGIRWLIHKRELNSRNAKRPLTWTESVVKYKGLDLSKKSDQNIYNDFLRRSAKYQK